MSAIGAIPENICCFRALPVLTLAARLRGRVSRAPRRRGALDTTLRRAYAVPDRARALCEMIPLKEALRHRERAPPLISLTRMEPRGCVKANKRSMMTMNAVRS
jgi:hypothetical protein